MKNLKALTLLLILTLLITGCYDDGDDITTVTTSEINDFVWKGMNALYLYKQNVPNLANNRFSSDEDYTNYLEDFTKPQDLFESLIYERKTVDRFSWIVDDYFELERQFQGITGTNGMEFGFFATPNSSTEGFCAIRLVLPNSPADNNNLKRGDIFYGIDGNRLTNDNINALLNQETYTINLGFYNDKGTPETTDDSIDPLNKDITLTKVQYTENPIHKTDVITVGGEKVGYLMYNGFTSGSENALNTVFADFKSNNIQHLIVDLRYNPGGSVSTETYLASMITGQFTGEVFQKLVYNEDLQAENNTYKFTNKIDEGSAINSLGLTKLYILTTGRSASASEGLINGLNPYIDVIQLGTNTTGKTQASITIYDSPNFGKKGANPGHTYAMQPLVANGVNKDDVTVPSSGITPKIELEESPLNYGILGNIDEPLLAAALADIEGSTVKIANIKAKSGLSFKLLKDSNDLNPFEGGMRINQ
ncbi:S41 family peptidase [Flavivirga eckloniae]|uniref:Peptidase S41 n=1 Tax=Flavivirga eckloniae TaxID=1803846 RepID=A0A2K9PUU4_9FLAO|nr:S41 family peptidase [Flavivirga eckloniae]AUP80840.1 peptidase S41 [Flavivirga eckloniae]